MVNVVITGGAGFLGSRLARALLAGEIRRAIAEADESDPDPVIRAQHLRRHRGQSARDSSREFAQKMAA